MRAPAFWWARPGIASALLSPLGLLYGAITARRMARPGHHPGAPVVCVGNLVAGGAGKTPAAICVAQHLRQLGEVPVFLSRGYGRRSADTLVVDRDRHRPEDVGDEPLLLARHAVTVVAADRIGGARVAASHGSVIVMDDGLQNPSLAKDLAIAVVDGGVGVGNGLCIPAGPLRAPVPMQLGHVDAVLVVGPGAPGEEVAALAAARGRAVLRASLVPDQSAIAALRGRRVFAFAGIGRPEKFFRMLEDCSVVVAARRAFADHHAFGPGEVEAILLAAEADALIPVTTEKDAVRLRSMADAKIRAIPVALVPSAPADLTGLVATALAGARRLGQD